MKITTDKKYRNLLELSQEVRKHYKATASFYGGTVAERTTMEHFQIGEELFARLMDSELDFNKAIKESYKSKIVNPKKETPERRLQAISDLAIEYQTNTHTIKKALTHRAKPTTTHQSPAQSREMEKIAISYYNLSLRLSLHAMFGMSRNKTLRFITGLFKRRYKHVPINTIERYLRAVELSYEKT